MVQKNRFKELMKYMVEPLDAEIFDDLFDQHEKAARNGKLNSFMNT